MSGATAVAAGVRRTRMAAWNFASMMVFNLVTVATGLLITPALVRHLGDRPYGAYRMVADYCGYLTLLELGLGAGLGPLLARAAGRGDDRALRGTLAAGFRVYAGVTAAIVAVGLALTPWAGRLIPVDPALVGQVRLAWLISVASFLSLALMPLRALTEADQRGFLVTLMMSAQAMLVAGLSLGLAVAGWGVASQAAALLVGNLAVAATLAVDALRRRPALLRGALAARPDAESWRDLLRLSPPTFLINICGRIGLLTDYIIVGTLLGPETVTMLFLTQRLVVIGQAQLQAIGTAVWAGLAELHAQGDVETFRRRVVELTNLITVLGIAGLAPVVAYNRAFFHLWVPAQPYAGPPVVIVATLNALLTSLASFWLWCVNGTGQVRRAAPFVPVATAINIGASVGLTWYFRSPVGPLLGTTLGSLFNLCAYPLLLRRAFGVEPRALAGAVLGPLAVGLPYAAALRWFAHAHRPAGWAGLMAEMPLSALAFLLLAWALLLNPTDRARWRLRLLAIRPTRRAHEPIA